MELKPVGGPPVGAPQPSFVYVSKATGSVVRGVSSWIERDVVTHSILHPGLFVSVVLRGAAKAGPSEWNASIEYCDGNLVAFAVAETTDWVGVLSEGAAMRGVGISVPFSALASLGLSESFQRLFESGGRIAIGRASADARLQGICENMLQMRAPDDCGRVLLDAYSMEAIVAGLRLLRDGHKKELRPFLKDRLSRARDLIETELTGQWTVDELAGKVGLGARSLRAHFRNEFGQSVTEYARNARLDRARAALAQRNITVSEAAYDAGYNNPANFATAFRRRFGYAPSKVQS
ncbi:putative HTH araC/xylS-type domain-containing protein [Hyphomicrobiales bacterium]|nr:putative HTH araC/xylS-type domain-containing protein [Hyphomicrobiales bacterium]CAH1701050.1 putative HTH araC/xylS-type domain-containing protein [Hyphomicrobiales bacterium]CAI0344109.1 putative HTH araC/xylS-type domain-containing protein [Hyphomicrobiales bacterium]